MNIGKLNNYVRVDRPVAGQEGEFGTPTITWVLQSMSWLNKSDMLPSRSEAIKNGLAMSASQTRFRGRYRTDIDASMRIVMQTTPPIVYQIISAPAMLGNKDGIEFMAERVSS